MNGLFLRALVAFLVLPGMIGFAIPLLAIEPRFHERPLDAWGLVPVLLGAVLLLACVREFYVAGKGTLAPWSPPKHLVTSGPYRFSRNPMYVAMTSLLIGWAWAFHSMPLTWYALFMVLAFHVRILLGEEPRLAEVFGSAWQDYRGRAPRWIGVTRQKRS